MSVEDSVAISRPISGKDLREQFAGDIRTLTFGLVHLRGTSMRAGPLEILRFGSPKVTRNGIEWPIEGGLVAGGPGGSFAVRAIRGRLVATLEGYRPRIPVFLYALTQLPIHHTVTRLHLLRARGRLPSPGVPAAPPDRLLAGAIDFALCAGVALMAGRRRRLPALAGITAGYHIACWSSSGRTVGGIVMRQRVVAVDGSRPSIGQSLVRLLTIPLAALRLRAVHDEIAGTEVVAN